MDIKYRDYSSEIEKNGKKAERRFITTEIRGGKDSNVLEGYAAVFNKDSENFGGWVEQIAPGAFSDVLNDNAFALFNHSMNYVLGRNGANVTLSEDEVGLKFKIDPMPDTTLSRDIMDLVKRDILNKCSFAFIVQEESWIKGDEKSGKPSMRVIQKVAELFDVSVVTIPAYQDTSVAARSFEKVKATTTKEEGIKEIREGIKNYRGLMRLKTSLHKRNLTKTIF